MSLESNGWQVDGWRRGGNGGWVVALAVIGSLERTKATERLLLACGILGLLACSNLGSVVPERFNPIPVIEGNLHSTIIRSMV